MLSNLFSGGDTYVVRAATWFGAEQEEQAKSEARALLAQLPGEVAFDLRRLEDADGTVRFVLLVGEASEEVALQTLLDTVRAASLPDAATGERPFAGAVIALSSETSSS